VITKAKDNLSKKGAELARILPPESVLVSCIGILGKTGINKIPVAFNQQINAVIFPMGIVPKFGFCYFQTSEVKKWLYQISSATTIPIVNKSKFQMTPFPIAPTPEQGRIVAKVEELITKLDVGVESLREVKARLGRYRQAVLKYTFEGKLTEKWRRTHKQTIEPASILLERILEERKKNTKGKYTRPFAPQTSNLPKLPDGWVWASWDQLSEWVTYGFTRPMPHVTEGIPIITAKNIKYRKIQFQKTHKTTTKAFEELSEKDRPKKNDILITKDGTIGKAAIVKTENPFCINQSVAVIWLRDCPINREYLLSVIEFPFTQNLIWSKARGVALKHFSITDFKKMPLPIPSLPEQRAIVEEIEQRFSVIAEVQKVAEQNLMQSERLRQSVLKTAFEGRLVPQDPTDEPAEKLLERIREEKEKLKSEEKKKKSNRKSGLKQLELVRYVK